MKIEQCIICEMVDGSFKSIGRKEFEFKKNNVLKVVDFVDNYKEAQAYVGRLTKKREQRRGKF